MCLYLCICACVSIACANQTVLFKGVCQFWQPDPFHRTKWVELILGLLLEAFSSAEQLWGCKLDHCKSYASYCFLTSFWPLGVALTKELSTLLVLADYCQQRSSLNNYCNHADHASRAWSNFYPNGKEVDFVKCVCDYVGGSSGCHRRVSDCLARQASTSCSFLCDQCCSLLSTKINNLWPQQEGWAPRAGASSKTCNEP